MEFVQCRYPYEKIRNLVFHRLMLCAKSIRHSTNMRRPRPSTKSIQKALQTLEQNKILEKRRRRLYNRKYRKSFFFISVWVGRLLYFSLFVIVCSTHEIINTTRQEVLNNCEIEEYQAHSRRGSYQVTEVSLETQYGHYFAKLINVDLPKLVTGDTVIIVRNYYGKPIYFTQKSWSLMYGLTNNLIFYSFILFPTFVSFFFNDGLDRFTDKLLLLIWAADVIAISLYFLTSFQLTFAFSKQHQASACGWTTRASAYINACFADSFFPPRRIASAKKHVSSYVSLVRVDT